MQRLYSSVGPDYTSASTAELRDRYLADSLFQPGQLQLLYTDLDRAIVGSAVPGDAPLHLEAAAELRAATFCERRELGVINLGAAGSVTVDGERYAVAARECVYIGRGSQKVSFESDDAQQPAAFYLLSYPAHAQHSTRHATIQDAKLLQLGSPRDANERCIHQYIHEGGLQSCQLVMGFTELRPGSVWNTMPPHTHERRSEIYLYFDVPPGHQVAHFMGRPEETRALWVRNRQAVLSPSWSIHSGCGTSNYAFVWGMGGENQRFDDMAGVPPETLR